MSEHSKYQLHRMQIFSITRTALQKIPYPLLPPSTHLPASVLQLFVGIRIMIVDPAVPITSTVTVAFLSRSAAKENYKYYYLNKSKEGSASPLLSELLLRMVRVTTSAYTACVMLMHRMSSWETLYRNSSSGYSGSLAGMRLLLYCSVVLWLRLSTRIVCGTSRV
jgi:hypothetical protein